eukprot:1992504-Alexandrium_andersonii.AAC.1
MLAMLSSLHSSGHICSVAAQVLRQYDETKVSTRCRWTAGGVAEAEPDAKVLEVEWGVSFLARVRD